MQNRTCVIVMLVTLALLTDAGYIEAADDAADPIDWEEVSYDLVWVPYVDASSDLWELWQAKALHATANHIANHCRSDEVDPETGAPRTMNHWHFEKDFGDDDFPTVAEANRYWDWRFGIVSYNPRKTTRVSNATTLYNCHSWAFNQQADGGQYTYWCSQPSIAYADDFVKRDSIYDVEAGDLLRYKNGQGGIEHTSIVNMVYAPGQHPSLLEWKFEYSGVYHDAPPPGHYFDQPYNTCLDPSKTIASQTGTWDPALIPSKEVWRDD